MVPLFPWSLGPCFVMHDAAAGWICGYIEYMRVRISPLIPSRLCKACLGGMLCLLVAAGAIAGQTTSATSSTTHKKTAHLKTTAKSRKATSRHRRQRLTLAQRRTRTTRLKKAFVASTELRPMAEQLMTLRTPAAYEGVTSYARRHTGDAAGAAYLALGRAYQMDKRYGEAVSAYAEAKQHSEVLADYADFLGAECLHAENNDKAAEALLRGFDERYPDTIFDIEAPEMEANVLLAQGDATAAQQTLQTVADEARDMPNYELTEAKIAYAIQQNDEAERVFKQLLLSHPLSPEAEEARARLTAMGEETSLTAAELRSLGDAYYNAGRYELAEEQYRTLARNTTLPEAERNEFEVAAAAAI